MINTRATGTERIASELRDRILSGDFAAGSPLREGELSTEYKVSRHVIREVLRSLASEGMADYSSFRGARVPLVTSADVSDIYFARRFLECGTLSARGADVEIQALASIHGKFSTAVAETNWQRAFECDVQFHSSIVGVSGSARLIKWHRELMESLKLAHLVVPDFQAEGLRRSVPQHAEVIIALAASDIEQAAAALENHLTDAECLLLAGLADPPNLAVAASQRST